TYGTYDYPGGWREIIDGVDIPIHDDQFLTFDVIVNPFGSSSPLNDHHFPKKLTLGDIVRANERGMQALGYDKIDIVIGRSLGG
ncbi:homoserine acetyltransferase, partial [Staphylococcus aureus]